MIVNLFETDKKYKVLLVSRRVVIIDAIGLTLSPASPHAELTHEEFMNPQTQMVIKAGYLRVIDGE